MQFSNLKFSKFKNDVIWSRGVRFLKFKFFKTFVPVSFGIRPVLRIVYIHEIINAIATSSTSLATD
jgi:hypothetical protein